MIKIWMFAPLLLGGCVTSKPVSLPNGNQGLAINCSGRFDLSDCMNKAAQVCGGPYQVIDGNSEGSGAVTVGNTFVQAHKRMLIVSCGK